MSHGLPSRLDWHDDWCTPDSRRLAAPPKSAGVGPFWKSWPWKWRSRHKHARHVEEALAGDRTRLALGRADIDTSIGMVIILLLQLVKMSIPHLVCLVRIPCVGTILVSAQVTNLLSLRCEPSIQQWIRYRLRQLVANCRRSRVCSSIAVWRRRPRHLADIGISVWNIRIDNRS